MKVTPDRSRASRGPQRHAHRSDDQLAGPRRELRVLTAEEGATGYIGLDHLPPYWDADTFAELSTGRRS